MLPYMWKIIKQILELIVEIVPILRNQPWWNDVKDLEPTKPKDDQELQ